MIKIMFVCHGNICRSPMAEFIFKKLIKERGVSDLFSASSSATSDEEIYGSLGNPIYPPAKRELERHKVPYENRHAIQLIASDFERYDLFIGMDSRNIRNMKLILGNRAEGKIKKLLDYTENGGDVSDPWYSGRFDIAYEDIHRGCVSLLETLLNKHSEDNR